MQRSRNVQPKMREVGSIHQTIPQMTHMLELVDKNIKRVIRVFQILNKVKTWRVFSKRPKVSFKE